MAQPAQESGQPGQTESMEDILQSIKRIIEDDTGAEAKPAAGAPAAADVLDLTQVVGADGTVAPLAPALKPVNSQSAPPATEDIVKSIDTMLAQPSAPSPKLPAAAPKAPPALPPELPPAAPAPIQATPAAVKPSVPKPQTMEEGLVSDQAAQAAAAALKPIVEGAKKDYSVPHIPSPPLRGGHTVEDLLLEALRPMLKAWLDEHLPTIVQKIVEKEVKRIVTFHAD